MKYVEVRENGVGNSRQRNLDLLSRRTWGKICLVSRYRKLLDVHLLSH